MKQLKKELFNHKNDILTKNFKLSSDQFIKIMQQNFFKDLLENMYSNLNNIKIEKVTLNDCFGKYNIKENKITLSEENFDYNNIYHELFHMATRFKHLNMYNCGFYFYSGKVELGRAINEGYTEIMCNRYFGTNISESNYINEIKICKKIEKLIGKSKLEELYLKADLKGLINEMKQYLDVHEVVKILMDLDKILYLEESNTNPDVRLEIEDTLLDIEIALLSLELKKNNEFKDDITYYKRVSKKSENNIGKSLFRVCLETLKSKYEENNNHSFQSEIEKIFGYETLKKICLCNGIDSMIDELKKYFTLENVIKYICLYELYDNLNINEYKKLYGENYISKWQEDFDIIYQKINNINFLILLKKKYYPNEDLKIDISNNKIFEYFKVYRWMIEYRMNNRIINFEPWNYLEDLIGKDKLLKIFITNNEIELIKELQKIASTDELKNLIDAPDIKCFENQLSIIIDNNNKKKFKKFR